MGTGMSASESLDSSEQLTTKQQITLFTYNCTAKFTNSSVTTTNTEFSISTSSLPFLNDGVITDQDF